MITIFNFIKQQEWSTLVLASSAGGRAFSQIENQSQIDSKPFSPKRTDPNWTGSTPFPPTKPF